MRCWFIDSILADISYSLLWRIQHCANFSNKKLSQDTNLHTFIITKHRSDRAKDIPGHANLPQCRDGSYSKHRVLTAKIQSIRDPSTTHRYKQLHCKINSFHHRTRKLDHENYQHRNWDRKQLSH